MEISRTGGLSRPDHESPPDCIRRAFPFNGVMDLYRARWILPIDRDPIENGALLVDGDRIIAVGPRIDSTGAAVHDLGDVVLLPGFINAHTHLELSCYHGRLSPAPLWVWLEELVTLRRQSGAPEAERQGMLDGAAQSLAAGVTCLGDICRTGLNVELLRTSPIRKVCFLEIFSAALQPPNDIPSLRRALEKVSPFADTDRLMIGLSPHAPYSVAWPDLLGTMELADRYALPLTMHLVETKDEQQWLSGGVGPLTEFLTRYGLPNAQTVKPPDVRDILLRSGLLDRGPLLAHVNYADDELLSLLAQSRASVVWCPRTHAFFGHSPHRWREMISLGINVCLGTDSLASSPSLSILDELRFLHRQAPDVDPGLLFDMAIRKSAIALRLNDSIGSLTSGKYADFIAIPLEPDGPVEPMRNILECKNSPVSTWVGGHPISRPIPETT
jgi:aminodeoxyfutalosine deaminase